MSKYQQRIEHYGDDGLIETEIVEFDLEGEDEHRHLAPDRVRETYKSLRKWSEEAKAAHDDWPNKNQGQKDAAMRETLRRMGVLFDRIADMMLMDGKS